MRKFRDKTTEVLNNNEVFVVVSSSFDRDRRCPLIALQVDIENDGLTLKQTKKLINSLQHHVERFEDYEAQSGKKTDESRIWPANLKYPPP